MKYLTIILAMVLIASAVAIAGRPTPTVDTLLVDANGNLAKYQAFWNFATSATPDTLTMPVPGSKIEIIHKGGATGDTILVSASRTGTVPGFTYRLSTVGEKVDQDWDARVLSRVIVKAQAGTGRVWIRIRN